MFSFEFSFSLKQETQRNRVRAVHTVKASDLFIKNYDLHSVSFHLPFLSGAVSSTWSAHPTPDGAELVCGVGDSCIKGRLYFMLKAILMLDSFATLVLLWTLMLFLGSPVSVYIMSRQSIMHIRWTICTFPEVAFLWKFTPSITWVYNYGKIPRIVWIFGYILRSQCYYSVLLAPNC